MHSVTATRPTSPPTPSLTTAVFATTLPAERKRTLTPRQHTPNSQRQRPAKSGLPHQHLPPTPVSPRPEMCLSYPQPVQGTLTQLWPCVRSHFNPAAIATTNVTAVAPPSPSVLSVDTTLDIPQLPPPSLLQLPPPVQPQVQPRVRQPTTPPMPLPMSRNQRQN